MKRRNFLKSAVAAVISGSALSSTIAETPLKITPISKFATGGILHCSSFTNYLENKLISLTFRTEIPKSIYIWPYAREKKHETKKLS